LSRHIYMPGYGPESVAHDEIDVEIFPDGEQAVGFRITDSEDVYLYGGCYDADSSEAFLAAAYELARRGPRSLTIYNLYFRNARCERPFLNKAGNQQAVMAKFQAQLWSGVGRMFPGVRMILLDLHTSLVLSFFEGAVHATEVSAVPMLLEAFFKNDPHPRTDWVFGTVDMGQSDTVRRIARKWGVGFGQIEKRRRSPTVTEVVGVSGDDVKGKRVQVIDDVIATGGSLANAVRAYYEMGAVSVCAIAPHGLFAGNALEKLREANTVRVDVTNSHPNAVRAASKGGLVHVHRLNRQNLTS
jgi:ribose-phosphate pyrophosphokinase